MVGILYGLQNPSVLQNIFWLTKATFWQELGFCIPVSYWVVFNFFFFLKKCPLCWTQWIMGLIQQGLFLFLSYVLNIAITCSLSLKIWWKMFGLKNANVLPEVMPYVVFWQLRCWNRGQFFRLPLQDLVCSGTGRKEAVLTEEGGKNTLGSLNCAPVWNYAASLFWCLILRTQHLVVPKSWPKLWAQPLQ